MADNKKRTRRRFTDEFKRNAVELVRTTGKPIAEVARDLGVTETSLGRWVAQDRVDRGEREGLTSQPPAAHQLRVRAGRHRHRPAAGCRGGSHRTRGDRLAGSP